MQDNQLENQLRSAAKAAPPIAHIVSSRHPAFLMMQRLYADDAKISAILHEANNGFPPGLIVFGYEDGTSMKPITDVLDKVPRLQYASITLHNGTPLYFMSHSAAQDHLPPPNEVGNKRIGHLFTPLLIDTLEGMQQQEATRHQRVVATHAPTLMGR